METRDHLDRPTSRPNPFAGARFRAGDSNGFYESYFQRANHPTRPRAFWIRYTAFSPEAHPESAIGELWAVYFDGEAPTIVAVRQTFPLTQCQFAPDRLQVRIGESILNEHSLNGSSSLGAHRIAWGLAYEGEGSPVLLLPERMYETSFPKAKAMVGRPNAIFHGSLEIDGESKDIDGWQGSQNHNWGRRHTDRYAWGQVAGFDDAPDVFLECATAQVRVGPLWTPPLTLVVLREGNDALVLNTLWQGLRARSHLEFFRWEFDCRGPLGRIHGSIHASPSSFVGLTYLNPPGGSKTCLNSKLAAADIVVERPGRVPRRLTTRNRAAFEILTDRTDHGVAIAV